jgi:signal peptidase I
MIILIIIVVLGFWFGSRIILNTDYPMLAVASGSMSLPQGVPDDGWSRPFARTLHTGDLILVEGVNVSDIYAAPYPNGTIVVYRSPNNDELIVHRAIEKKTINDKVYYVTKGDGNLGQDPDVPAENIIGKVIFRIPWVGHLALFMRNSSGVYLIIALIIILIIIELLIPMVRRKKPAIEQPQQNEQTPQTDNPESSNATKP